MDVTEFNNILNNLLKKINQEQKTVFLLGDFNIDLMHYNEHKPTNEFLDSLASNSYLPYIIQPSRHTSHSRTLIDNIFSNVISKDIISDNIIATISDHLPEFLITTRILNLNQFLILFLITTAQLHSSKSELRFCAGSNPAQGVSEIRDGEDLWQWSQLEIRLNTFYRSTIPQQQFIIIIIICWSTF